MANLNPAEVSGDENSLYGDELYEVWHGVISTLKNIMQKYILFVYRGSRHNTIYQISSVFVLILVLFRHPEKGLNQALRMTGLK